MKAFSPFSPTLVLHCLFIFGSPAEVGDDVWWFLVKSMSWEQNSSVRHKSQKRIKPYFSERSRLAKAFDSMRSFNRARTQPEDWSWKKLLLCSTSSIPDLYLDRGDWAKQMCKRVFWKLKRKEKSLKSPKIDWTVPKCVAHTHKLCAQWSQSARQGFTFVLCYKVTNFWPFLANLRQLKMKINGDQF